MDKAHFIRSELRAKFSITDDISYTRPMGRPQFIAKLRGRNGRKIHRFSSLKNRLLQLFYEVPRALRSGFSVPDWYSKNINQPKYLFRLPGKKLSPKQVILSVTCRLYYLYRFRLRRSRLSTNGLIKVAGYDSIYRLLRLIKGRNWYTISQIVYRKLKVLFCPFRTFWE